MLTVFFLEDLSNKHQPVTFLKNSKVGTACKHYVKNTLFKALK